MSQDNLNGIGYFNPEMLVAQISDINLDHEHEYRQHHPNASPPQYQLQASPPQFERQTSPPLFQRQASPPLFQRQASPPLYQCQASPLQYQHQASPPQYQRQASPPQYQRQASPSLYQLQASPPQYQRISNSPLQYQPNVSPPLYSRNGSPRQYPLIDSPPQYQRLNYVPPHQDIAASYEPYVPSPIHAPSGSPWDNSRSGYSSASPAGTASCSSGSSSNSHGYERSPPEADDEINPELINSLLRNNNHQVRSPSSRAFGGPRCGGDCGDLFCDYCQVPRPVMGRPSSSNLPEQYGSLRCGSSMGVASPSLRRPHSASPSHMSSRGFACQYHSRVSRRFCETCGVPFCPDCDPVTHMNHVNLVLVDAVENANRYADRLITDLRRRIAAMSQEHEDVQLSAGNLDVKARQAIQDVSVYMRSVANAVLARERELAAQIESARVAKYNAFLARDEVLRNGISELTNYLDQLSNAVDASFRTGNPIDILRTNDMASAEIFQICQAQMQLVPTEESWISFNGNLSHILHELGVTGSVVMASPGPIGDRRAVRGRGASPSRMVTLPPPIVFQPIPRGRPIAANILPVVARVAHRGLAGLPISFVTFGNNCERASNNLCRPWGVTCDFEGRIVVADRSNNRIQIYREDGLILKRFGSHGTAPGQFDRPAGVAVDCRRRIIVADKDNHRIQIFTMEGTFILKFGDKGNRNGQFNYPWDVAANNVCQIVVSDTRNHRVQLFSPEGVFLRKYGYETTPAMWKHFDSPRGVAFTPEGKIMTTDFNNHRLVLIDADFLNARVFNCEAPPGAKQFLRPQGLVIDDEGNIVVSDSRNHRIQVFNSEGRLLRRIGCYGQGENELDRPSGITLTPSGRIVVVDFGNNRITII